MGKFFDNLASARFEIAEDCLGLAKTISTAFRYVGLRPCTISSVEIVQISPVDFNIGGLRGRS